MNVIGQSGRDAAVATTIAAMGLVVAVGFGWFASKLNPIIMKLFMAMPVAMPGAAVIALYVAIPAAALIALYVAGRPTWLLWFALFGGLVVSGLTRLYVPQLQLVRWALGPIALVLALHALMNALGRRPGSVPLPAPAPIPWAIAFIGVAVVASLAGDFAPARLAVGLKGYFQVWGLLMALAFFPWPEKVIDRLPRIFLALALLQIPFVLHQLFFLVPKRVDIGDGIVPIDIVAGTFGAALEGGGANAVMNAFLAMVIAGLIAAWQGGCISTRRVLLLVGPLLFPIMVNEAKVSVLYLLAVFGVLYGKDIIRRPLRFLGASASAGLVVLLLMVAYTLNAPSQAGVKSLGDLLAYTWNYNVTQSEENGKLSRFGALKFWAGKQGVDNLKGILLGHGAGYTRVGDNNGDFREVVRATTDGIPSDIDLTSEIGNTAIAALLWETGLIGVFCIFGLLAATFRAAGRLERIYGDLPERLAALRGARAAVVIIAITLVHKNVLVFDVAYQTLVMFVIGFVAYWERQASLAGARAADNRRPGTGSIPAFGAKGHYR